jgi:hypothetical protein
MPLNSEVFYSRIWCLKYLSSSSLRWNRFQVTKELLALKMEGGSGNILAGSETVRLKCQDSDETQRDLIYTPSALNLEVQLFCTVSSESFIRYKPTSSEDHLDPETDTTTTRISGVGVRSKHAKMKLERQVFSFNGQTLHEFTGAHAYHMKYLRSYFL